MKPHEREIFEQYMITFVRTFVENCLHTGIEFDMTLYRQAHEEFKVYVADNMDILLARYSVYSFYGHALYCIEFRRKKYDFLTFLILDDKSSFAVDGKYILNYLLRQRGLTS